ncbi:hypothetical protein ACIHFC_36965 [Streptomyces sp. NPDC052013]|uniref:hypothetical protein n=1 Tax=Streptomyces sp. NPDC052013 TaxID=3365679 RepID=UPI0037D36399
MRDYFPAARGVFDDLDAADTLELLGKAPTPAQAAKLTTGQISAALKRAHRKKNVTARAKTILGALGKQHLGQPDEVSVAYAASITALIAV